MFFAVMILLGLLIACGVWYLLRKTKFSPVVKGILALLIGFGFAALLYWALLYLSILAFQLHDRVGW